jgi:hypothetical protein
MGGRKPAEYRKLRQRYKPKSISLVIIAESPPSNGKYFYDRNGLPSEPLFAAMMKQLGVDPRCPKEDGLREFQRKGWFLVDATYKPVDKLSDSSADRVIKRRYQSLRNDLATLIPDRSTPLVLIKVNVCHILEPRLTEDGFSVLNGGRAVYFPSNGRQPDFHRQFGAILESAGITQTAKRNGSVRKELAAGVNQWKQSRHLVHAVAGRRTTTFCILLIKVTGLSSTPINFWNARAAKRFV